ncbi:MAG: hypothetical protein AMXMBFR84_10980 [Candidatus Hydrogenedentota bacterium]
MSNSSSWIYSSPWVYGLVMRLLYGSHYGSRYESLAGMIPAGVSLVDVCAGDCRLYTHYLKSKGVSYTALDISPGFVNSARKSDIDARQFDANVDPIPAADFIVMQASLYQFLPDAAPIVRRMLESARQRVLIAEPVRNLSDSNVPVLSGLSRWLTKPQSGRAGQHGDRFTDESFRSFVCGFSELDQIVPIPGGRELIAVFRRDHGA